MFFEKYDKLIGGCIWDWVDQSIRVDLGGDKKNVLTDSSHNRFQAEFTGSLVAGKDADNALKGTAELPADPAFDTTGSFSVEALCLSDRQKYGRLRHHRRQGQRARAYAAIHQGQPGILLQERQFLGLCDGRRASGLAGQLAPDHRRLQRRGRHLEDAMWTAHWS